MESNLLIFVKYQSETLVLNALQSSNYGSLERSFSLNWPDAFISHICFYYEIDGHSRCCLKNDDDLTNMILVCRSLGLKLINVSALDTIPSESVDNRLVAMSQRGGDVIDGDCLDIGSCSRNDKAIVCALFDAASDSDEDVYDICPTNSKKMLLSDGWGSLIIGVGQKFSSVDEYRISLIKYASHVGFEYKFERNEPKRVYVVCSKNVDEGCAWFIKGSASMVDKCFYIKSMNNVHSCMLDTSVLSTKRVGCRFLSGIAYDSVHKKHTFSPMELVQMMFDLYGMSIGYQRARNAVEAARDSVFGNFKQSFNELGWYSDAVMKTNVGSHVVLDIDSSSRQFKRFFVSFGACIDGFKFCRPMLFLDGTFMKSRFKGTVLSATSKDANNGLFPIAFGVVLAENKDNWLWFLSELKKIIPDNIFFVTDRNQGLIEALDIVFHGNHQFYCLQHLKLNLLDFLGPKRYSPARKERLCFLLIKMAKAPNVRLFDEYMKTFTTEGGDICRSFLNDIPFSKWAIAFSTIPRYGEMTSNAAESLNHCMLEARGLPITHLINAIRIKLMDWFVERRILAESWDGILCHRYDLKWKKYMNVSSSWNVKKSNVEDGVFEVFSNPTVIVNISKKSCSCCRWETKGFPCCHVAAVVRRSRVQLRDIINPLLTVSYYKLTYQSSIVPVPSTERFDIGASNSHGEIKPPDMRRLSGRPRKSRIKSRGEECRPITCGRCGKIGHHNKKSCREAVIN